MKSLHQSKNVSWRLGLMLIIMAFVASACSIISEPENTEAVYDGAPIVRIAAPLANDTYYEGVGVNIVARVENAGPDIARVIITLDGQIIGEQALPNSSGAPSFIIANGWVATGIGTHTISVVASRNDGTPSNPVNVSINVVAALASSQTTNTTNNTTAPTQAPADTGGDTTVQTQPTSEPANTSAPANTVAPTDVPPPSDTPEPTDVPATDTPSRPQVRVTTGANIRRGPDTSFEPPIGSLAQGAVQDLLAVSTNGQWYKIRYYNGEGWIFANTVEVMGDISNLPREAGPPTAIPFTATPVATSTPTAVADLSITSATTSPFPLECGVNSTFRFTVANSGTGSSSATKVAIQDIYNGNVIKSLEADVRALAPGESQSFAIDFEVSTYVNEGHTSRIRVDPNNLVAETNENNNTNDNDYPLQSSDVC